MGKAPGRVLDGLCSVRVRGSGRAGLSRSSLPDGRPCGNRAESAHEPAAPVVPRAVGLPARPARRCRRRSRGPAAGGSWSAAGSSWSRRSVAAVGLFIWTLAGFLDTDATVAADGAPAPGHASATGGDRMLWLEDGFATRLPGRRPPRPATQIRPRPGRGVVRPLGLAGRLARRRALRPRLGRPRGHLRRRPDRARSLIGPAPRIGSFVGGLLATIFVPLVLGLLGLAVLIVTGILFGRRAPSRLTPRRARHRRPA